MASISKEVKNEVIEKVKGGERVAELSESYGISTKTIYYWLRKKSEGAISVIEYNRLKRENRELKEIVGALTVQLEKDLAGTIKITPNVRLLYKMNGTLENEETALMTIKTTQKHLKDIELFIMKHHSWGTPCIEVFPIITDHC